MATGSLGEADKGTQYNNNLWCDLNPNPNPSPKPNPNSTSTPNPNPNPNPNLTLAPTLPLTRCDRSCVPIPWGGLGQEACSKGHEETVRQYIGVRARLGLGLR